MSRVQNIQQAGFEVVRRLRDHGHIALFTGGCVRDMLLGIGAKDVDVATNAPPERVCEIFSRTRKVGAAFGVVLVRQGRYWIETATFRTDLSYKDGRRPEGVVFSTPEEDAQRRDFTINGLFYDPIEDRLIDYVGGEADLRARIIRAIGEPDRRFGEDHLRLLRAVRFATRFDFEIEPLTAQAIRAHAAELMRISVERIREELDKTFSRPGRGRAVELIVELGLLPHLWPGAECDLAAAALAPTGTSSPAPVGLESPKRKGEPDWLPPAVRRIEALPQDADFVLTMASLLIGTAPARMLQIGRSLRCSNEQTFGMVWLVENAPHLLRAERLSLAQFKRLLAHRRWPDLLGLHAARLSADGADDASYQATLRRAAEIPEDEIAPPPLIVGDDLLRLGLQQGPQYKQLLERLYDAQLNGEIRTRPAGLALLQGMVTSQND